MAALLTSLGISIHAPREGGDIDIPNRHTDDSISIHAPREGGDALYFFAPGSRPLISIHAPREGGDCSPIWVRL